MTRTPAPPGSIPNDGRLDPATVDVAKRQPRKPRQRKARSLPDPLAELIEWAKGAEERLFARPYPPGIILEPAGLDKEHWTSPHADVGLWQAQLGEAFGTRSKGVLTLFLRQLEALCSKDQWDEDAKQWRLDENEFSAALAMVNAIKPKNEMEAALAAQMVSVHLMQMKCAARAIRFEHDTQTAAVAAKLARTFVIQMQALQAIRGKSKLVRQSIKVTKELNQHVHYHRGDRNGWTTPSNASPAASRTAYAAKPGRRRGIRAARQPSPESAFVECMVVVVREPRKVNAMACGDMGAILTKREACEGLRTQWSAQSLQTQRRLTAYRKQGPRLTNITREHRELPDVCRET